MSQLSLTLPTAPDTDGDRFVVAASNEQAFRLVESWPQWSGPSLALCGPAGSGKSLLAHRWTSRVSAVSLNGRSVNADQALAIAYAGTAVCLEQPELMPEATLLHLLNAISERQGSLLLTHRQAPSQWAVDLPDLRSRLAALPVALLEQPDDGLLRAILVKKFSARQVRVGADLLDYLLARCERSAASIEAMAELLDSAALAQGKPITLPLARSVLAQSTAS